MATMNTSNPGSKRLINSNNYRVVESNSGGNQEHSQINIGVDASQTNDGAIATSNQKPSIASRLEPAQLSGIYTGNIMVSRPGQHRLGGTSDHDQVFKSLEIEYKQMVGADKNYGGESNEVNLADDVSRMKQRPMTGAAIHRTRSKHRRFGPYNGGTIRG